MSSFEDGSVGGWANGANCTLANSTAQAFDGSHCLAVTSIAAGDAVPLTPFGINGIPAIPGLRYTCFVAVRAATVPRNSSIGINCYGPTGSNIGTLGAPQFPDLTTGWIILTATGITPPTTSFVDLAVNFSATGAAGEVHYLDHAYLDFN
jgi:hypothetical protein